MGGGTLFRDVPKDLFDGKMKVFDDNIQSLESLMRENGLEALIDGPYKAFQDQVLKAKTDVSRYFFEEGPGKTYTERKAAVQAITDDDLTFEEYQRALFIAYVHMTLERRVKAIRQQKDTAAMSTQLASLFTDPAILPPFAKYDKAASPGKQPVWLDTLGRRDRQVVRNSLLAAMKEVNFVRPEEAPVKSGILKRFAVGAFKATRFLTFGAMGLLTRTAPADLFDEGKLADLLKKVELLADADMICKFKSRVQDVQYCGSIFSTLAKESSDEDKLAAWQDAKKKTGLLFSPGAQDPLQTHKFYSAIAVAYVRHLLDKKYADYAKAAADPGKAESAKELREELRQQLRSLLHDTEKYVRSVWHAPSRSYAKSIDDKLRERVDKCLAKGVDEKFLGARPADDDACEAQRDAIQALSKLSETVRSVRTFQQQVGPALDTMLTILEAATTAEKPRTLGEISGAPGDLESSSMPPGSPGPPGPPGPPGSPASLGNRAGDDNRAPGMKAALSQALAKDLDADDKVVPRTDLPKKKGSSRVGFLVFLCIIVFGLFMIFFPILVLREEFVASPEDEKRKALLTRANQLLSIEPMIVRACCAVVLIGLAGLLL